MFKGRRPSVYPPTRTSPANRKIRVNLFEQVGNAARDRLALAARWRYNLGMHDLRVRRATESDLPTLGRLGAQLMQTHYAFDKERFMAPGANPAEGYSWFLGSQLHEKDVVVLVAERGGVVPARVPAPVAGELSS